MSTTNCKSKPCGCEDAPLVSPAPCNPIDCPTPYPCSEIMDAECVIYSGPDIECDGNIIVPSGSTMAEALLAIVNYVC